MVMTPKQKKLYLRATLNPAAMPESKTITPQREAELAKRQQAFDQKPLKPK
jgi:hypothetical protein